mgnify:CR=1 FL=1
MESFDDTPEAEYLEEAAVDVFADYVCCTKAASGPPHPAPIAEAASLG